MSQSNPSMRSPAKAFHLTGALAFMAIGFGALIAAKMFSPAFYALAAASVLGLALLSNGWTKAVDEVAQHAHMAAWFWGGLGGLALAVVSLFLLAATMTPPAMEERAFLLGFGFALAPMLLGYIAYWALFWLRRR